MTCALVLANNIARKGELGVSIASSLSRFPTVDQSSNEISKDFIHISVFRTGGSEMIEVIPKVAKCWK